MVGRDRDASGSWRRATTQNGSDTAVRRSPVYQAAVRAPKRTASATSSRHAAASVHPRIFLTF
jgi:hypothetical protein